MGLRPVARIVVGRLRRVEPVGIIAQNDSGLLGFRQGPESLKRPDAAPLSRSLPLRSEPFQGKHVRPFFAGILSEDGPRQQLASIFGISERNDLAVLERVRGECGQYAGTLIAFLTNASRAREATTVARFDLYPKRVGSSWWRLIQRARMRSNNCQG